MTVAAASVPMLLVTFYLVEAGNAGGSHVPEFVWQYLLGSTAAVATVAQFAIAVRRRVIGWPTCGIAAAGWLALCAVAGSVSLLLGFLEPARMALIAGVLALPLAPLAAAPLALAWNRHR
jgi:hypothetical protein